MRKARLVMMIALVAIMMTAISVDMAAAEGSDFHASIGYKAWLNQWQTSYIGATGTHILSMTSDYEFTSIPVLGLRYKDFFLSGSYYMETKFDFPDVSYEVTDPSVGTIIETLSASAKRSEWDASFGYYVHPSIAVSVGYKRIAQEYTDRYSSPGIIYTPSEFTSKTTYKGPTLGILVNAPIGSGVGIYGNLAYGPLKGKFEGESSSFNAPYVLAESGLNYKFEKAPLLINLGYRYQSLDSKPKDMGGQIGPDVTKGMVFGLSYIF